LSYISYKYEFPGGKVEADEPEESALVRELKEELNMDITVKKHLMTVNHKYPDFDLKMEAFMCNIDDPKVALTEHISYKWLSAKQMLSLDWAAADIPIVERLAQEGL
jgi:8-oxo-dGTP diphosphatase